MIFRETEVAGAYLVEPEPHDDHRGSFARVFCVDELAALGITFPVVQCSLSLNHRRGTLRGLHYQAPPAEETKLVRAVAGEIFDVALDLRPDSPTYLRHTSAVLSAANRCALLVPRGCAHGFQTLADGSEVLYMMDAAHAPDSARGVRWNDPAFGIDWPLTDPVMAERDAGYPDYAGGGAP